MTEKSAPPIPSLARVLLGLVEDANKERRLAVCLPVVDLEFVANEIIRFDRELARYCAPVSDEEWEKATDDCPCERADGGNLEVYDYYHGTADALITERGKALSE